MIGKIIKSGGVAVSGQEQGEHGVSMNWKDKGAGFQGELTLLHLYKAALSRGKAYSDHKHHHVHQEGENDDDGNNDDQGDNGNDDPMEQTTEHPFLENGQLKPRLPVHELLANKGVPMPTANLELLNALKTLNSPIVTKIEVSWDADRK